MQQRRNIMDCMYTLIIMLGMISSSLAQYDISYFATTIYSAAKPDHAVPIEIWYPNITRPTAPILVFGHCLFGPPDYYDYLWKTLVPKGYIVALPIGDRFSGRETELCADMRTTLDWIYDNCTVSNTCPFSNIIGNMSIASGHSEGAGSAVWCVADSWVGQKFNHTFDSGMTLSVCGQTAADGQSTFDAAKNLTKPFFFMDGSHDCTCTPEKYADRYYQLVPNNNGACKYEGIVTNGTHCDFADLQPAQQESCISLEEAECPSPVSHLTVKQQITIVGQYIELFMDATLRNYNNTNRYDVLNKQIQNDTQKGVMSKAESNNCN